MAQSVGAVALDIVAGKNTLNNTIRNSMNEAQNTANSGSSGISNALGKIGSVATAVGKTVAVGIGAGATAVVGLATSAVKSYADFEQLVGGVETLFGAGGKSLEEYAESVGKTVEEASEEYHKLIRTQNSVLRNAENAYRTAGLSQNEYMETVTSFSASLIQSLGGDTQKASDLANQAIIDMADNANKMGSSMESIQNAYQGFAKQNYTMLDNLKLGYGGTQQEMYRLLCDAKEIDKTFDAVFSLDDKGSLTAGYADIVRAINIVQTKMGITGTTAKEASETISGSIASMKSAWANLVNDIGAGSGDIDDYISAFVETVGTVADNVLPVAAHALGSIVYLIQELAPKIIEEIPKLVSQLLPAIIETSVSLIQAVVAVIPDLISAIVEQIPLFIQGIVQIVSALVQALPTIIQSLMEAFTTSGTDLISSLTTGLKEKIPEFLENALPMLVDFTAELSNNIGLIVDAGLDLVIALCEGLIDSLPTLIENIPQIVINICSIINDNAPKLITTAIYLIGQLVVGLIKAIPTIIQNIPKIIEAIVAVITAFNWINLGGKIVSGISDGVKNLPAKLLEFVKNAISNIKNAFTNGGIGGVVSNVFNGVKNGIKDILGGAWDFIKNTIKNIKDIFKFSWSLPHLKLPHFTVKPKGWEIGDLLKGKIPSLGIDWYAKAMNNPMIMNKPTIFGYDAGTGNLLGGGEAGSELVVGTNTLLSMIKSAVASVLGGSKMSIEVPALQNVRAGSSGSDGGLSDKMDRLIELFKQFIESGDSDMTVPIYIGNELIDEYILNKNNRNVLRSGGHA